MPTMPTAAAGGHALHHRRSSRYVRILLEPTGARIAQVHFQPWRSGMCIADFLQALADDRHTAQAAGHSAMAGALALLAAAIDPAQARAFNPTAVEKQLAWPAGPRRCQILKRLLRVPFGATVSYGELARLVTPPSGPRAVGQTMNKNPFPLIVPCHRVIQTGGGLGGFGGGLDWKRALLAWEAAGR